MGTVELEDWVLHGTLLSRPQVDLDPEHTTICVKAC